MARTAVSMGAVAGHDDGSQLRVNFRGAALMRVIPSISGIIKSVSKRSHSAGAKCLQGLFLRS